jgi:RND family efflux transporter MFP subunit
VQKRRGAENPLAVTVAEVREIPWERTIALVGTLMANQEARIAAEVEGSIEKTLVEVGDHVAVGAELAQIDTVSYQGMVNLHTANHNKAIANAENQRVNLERLQQLRKSGSVSPTDYDQAVAAEKQAAAEVAATKAQLGSATTALRRSLAVAPFAGAITDRLVNAGDFVRIGTVMFHLVDDSALKFRGEVPEREAARLKTGQTVRLNVDAWPGRSFQGTVSWINPAVNTNTRGVSVEARVENAERNLKANFFARAELIVDSASPALVVPIDAIVVFAGVTKVFVVEDDVAQSREVELGATRGDDQEIRSGLKPGERVVVSGRTKMQPGTRVTVEPAPVPPSP